MINITSREKGGYSFYTMTEWEEQGKPQAALISCKRNEDTPKGFEKCTCKTDEGETKYYLRPKKPRFVTASQVPKEPVRYLWYPYLIDRNVNVYGGESGTGKTYNLCSIMAAISRSDNTCIEGMPGLIERHGTVLYYGGEDDNSIVRERLEGMGANLGNIKLYDGECFSCNDGTLEEDIEEFNPVLVIFDALLSYFPKGLNSTAHQDCRRVMDNLRDIARKYKTSILVVVHPPKKDDYRLQFRFTGSAAFVDAARSVLYLGYHPNNDNLRVGIHVKCNYGKGEPFITGYTEDSGYTWHGTDNSITSKDIETATAKHTGSKGQTMEHYQHIIVELMKAHPTGIHNKTAKEILELAKRITNHDISVNSFSMTINREKFQETLKREGILIMRGTKGNNRQKYNIIYKESYIR